MKKVLIVGGGAAGLMAGYAAAVAGADVTLLERNSRPARKVMITGKGRCNVTNNTDIGGLIASVTDGGRFLYSAFNAWSAEDTMNFFENCGVPLKTERGNRVFPESDRAVDIVDALVGSTKSVGVKILCERVSALVCDGEAVTGVETESGKSFFGDAVIIATGGLSYPTTGSTGDGYKLAESVGHKVTEPRPSLVPLTVAEGWCFDTQGLSLKNIGVTVTRGGEKPVFSEFGELMFTHYGLSGPVILSASAYIKEPQRHEYKIKIDLKPALTEEMLDARLCRDFEKYSNKIFLNSLGDILPKKLIPTVVKLSGIEPSTKVNQITREQRKALIKVFKELTLTVTGFRPIEEAIVTKGGVALGEINPKTMESKLVKGLFFAGEVMDVDAFTGGYNLQIAFSTGYAAGTAAGREY